MQLCLRIYVTEHLYSSLITVLNCLRSFFSCFHAANKIDAPLVFIHTKCGLSQQTVVYHGYTKTNSTHSEDTYCIFRPNFAIQ